MEIDIVGENGERSLRAGMKAKLTIKIPSGYKQGDVACVVLPDCLAKLTGGTQVRKFQTDFCGKNIIQEDLVVVSPSKGQRWCAIVRNMYDSDRIGSVGLMTIQSN